MPRVNLVVIRSGDMDRAVKFYETIGLTFEKHRHGTGPEHYASENSGFVFEIYQDSNGSRLTTYTRLGFEVASVDNTVELLTGVEAEIISMPADSPWGRRAIVRDFDGHTVELTNNSLAS